MQNKKSQKKFTVWLVIGIVVIGLGYLGIQILINQLQPSQLEPQPPDIIESQQVDPQAPPVSTEEDPSVTDETNDSSEYYDIVMIGTELEGLYLARAAVDEGLSVLILEPRDAIGGQVLQGEMLFLDAVKDGNGRPLEQGRVKQLFDQFKRGNIRALEHYEQYFEDLMDSIPVHIGVTIENIHISKEERTNVNWLDYQLTDGTKQKVSASYWIENTDHGALTRHLDVNRLPGLETVYGVPEPEYMSSGMMMKFKNVDWQKFKNFVNSDAVKERNYGPALVDDSYALFFTNMSKRYTATSDLVFLRGLNAIHQGNGEVLINALLLYDVDPADDQSVADALQLGRSETELILEHFRKELVGWENAEINGFPNYLYVREFDHYETEYVLQVSDVLSGNMFWDNVSIAGYPLDLQGVRAVPWGISMGYPDKYGISLRSFLLKDHENVILAGKNIGASVVAYGSARIQPNTSLAAEVIGIILGQIGMDRSLHDLTEENFSTLHPYLEQEYNIKLTGITGENKISGWTEEEIQLLNVGKIIHPQYSR